MLNNNNYINDECMQYFEYEDDNILQEDVIHEITDPNSDETEVICRSDSCKMSDDISEKTGSILSNDLEEIIFDYTIIIDCLSTGCYQRSQSEITILSQLLQSIPDFICINGTELGCVCQAAKLISIYDVDHIIIRKGSVLNKWYFCLEGTLRKEDRVTTILGPGSSFGTDLWSKETLISDYDLCSSCDLCKLMVIGIEDLKSTNSCKNLIIKTNDHDNTVIAVYESFKNHSDSPDIDCCTLIKGTNDVLISYLFSNPKCDYVEDFFLTYKLFLNSSIHIRNDITNSIYSENENSKDKFNVLIRWLSQSFSEFEKDQNKLLFLEEIISILKNQRNDDWLYLLLECCSNAAKIREIVQIMSIKDCIVPVKVSEHNTLFYIHQVNNARKDLHNGDLITELQGYSSESLTSEIIKSFGDEQRQISMSVKNDLLGYHEHVLKDISADSLSIYSTPSHTQYPNFFSDKMSDVVSFFGNETDNRSITHNDKHIVKKPVILPSLFSNLQIGSFFKNSKFYANLLKRKRRAEPITAISSNNRSNSDVAARLNNMKNGKNDMGSSTFSISRFSRRLKSKRRRRSIGNDIDLIKSFDDLELSNHISQVGNKVPIRICFRDSIISSVYNSNTRSDLRYFHILIDPTTTVVEIIVRTLLKLNLISASSTEFHLVEVKVNDTNGMIHEKILNPNTCNLIDRLKEHSRFYLKHRSFYGKSLLLPSEADKMIEDFKTPSLLQMSINDLVVRLFLRSYKLLCKIEPSELIYHVACKKATLKCQKDSNKLTNGIFEYMHLSDFYKNWVISEICSIDSILTRASFIQYFIHLSFKAMYIGHIDLFFSILSGLESMEVLRLNLSWEKVSKRDKKLLKKLQTTLDVSGNMRNLRIVHQKMPSPFIPLTAMTIKDLTMLEETHSTYVSGMINGLQVNQDLVNFDKMREMSRLARKFVNSCCSCGDDKSRPIRKHMAYCLMKLENSEKLERFLQHKLEYQADNHLPMLCSHSLTEKRTKKYSFTNISSQSSSSESLSESGSSLKSNEEKSNCRAFEQRMMIMKIERYLKTLEDRVIIDPVKLSEMSLSCEQNNHLSGSYETKLRNSSKASKINDNDSLTSRLSSDIDFEILEKSAKIPNFKSHFIDSGDITTA